MNWNKLEDIQQFQELVAESKEKGSVFGVFKHSTHCGISRMVLRQFEKGWKGEGIIPLFYLDLLQFRTVSNSIENTTGVAHQSPQLIIIEKGEVVYEASHSYIDAHQALNSIAP